ncbi:hypothetical protein VPH35_098426 [Triticum aestivum]|uniref:Uncharacterized protein n=1 Tax=Aegilops tauschii subsp. strangulata TaxID=200361 RepID=A0A453L4Y3_AEGTS|nr:uncharacterized protein LOC109773720 [Aegilops tauschii subsp. strangulata]XP_040246472.1 uncharacterized protein LOC109773720 [Aegilops tauschii subsp. strangulata]XP_044397981.1 uncharacterized protein LOC123121947 [Triticum aestivum]
MLYKASTSVKRRAVRYKLQFQGNLSQTLFRFRLGLHAFHSWMATDLYKTLEAVLALLVQPYYLGRGRRQNRWVRDGKKCKFLFRCPGYPSLISFMFRIAGAWWKIVYRVVLI